MQSDGSGPIRKALVFTLGLVVVLSAVTVIIMDRKVSGLEEHPGAVEERMNAIEGRQDLIEGHQQANEIQTQDAIQEENP